jgi:hypothetical protein
MHSKLAAIHLLIHPTNQMQINVMPVKLRPAFLHHPFINATGGLCLWFSFVLPPHGNAVNNVHYAKTQGPKI